MPLRLRRRGSRCRRHGLLKSLQPGLSGKRKGKAKSFPFFVLMFFRYPILMEVECCLFRGVNNKAVFRYPILMEVECSRRRYNQEDMEVVQGQHRVYRLSCRAVWVCKYHRRVLKARYHGLYKASHSLSCGKCSRLQGRERLLLIKIMFNNIPEICNSRCNSTIEKSVFIADKSRVYPA